MHNRVLITSGPTREPLDPVRYLGNRSSGLTGLHLAEVFAEKYHADVVFISGPVCRYPEGVRIIPVETAVEMHRAVFNHLKTARIVIMAAAVSDFRPVNPSMQKIKKDKVALVIELEPNPDILEEAGRIRSGDQILVGFAAETDDPLINARRKFRSKNLDLLVLNEVSRENPAFGDVENRVVLVTADSETPLPKMPKRKLAERIAGAIIHMMAAESGGENLHG